MVCKTVKDLEKDKFFLKNGNWYVRTGDDAAYNSFDVTTTTITTTATQIELPDTGDYSITHQTDNGTIYIGSDNTVTSGDIKMIADSVIDITNGRGLELWAIAATGTVKVFVMALLKE